MSFDNDRHGLTRSAKRRAYHRNYMDTSDGMRPGGHSRKMTDEQVAEARRMLGPGFQTKHAVAKHFGVKPETLNAALKRPRPATGTTTAEAAR